MLYTVCTSQVNIQYSSISSRSRDVFTLMFFSGSETKNKLLCTACNSVSIVFNSSHRLFSLYFFLPHLTHNMHVNREKKTLQLHKFLFIKHTLFQCNTVFSAVNTYGCRRQWLTEKGRKNIGNVNALCVFLFDVYDIFKCAIRETVNRWVKRATQHTREEKTHDWSKKNMRTYK